LRQNRQSFVSDHALVINECSILHSFKPGCRYEFPESNDKKMPLGKLLRKRASALQILSFF
jgi:hypothetical protein